MFDLFYSDYKTITL